MGAKWVQLLTEIAPRTNFISAMFNPATAPVCTHVSAVNGSVAPVRRGYKCLLSAMMPTLKKSSRQPGSEHLRV